MFAYHNLTQLSELEIDEGWGIKDWGDFVCRIKFFKENTKTPAGKHRKKFEEKKTYEVIGDHRCNTYNIEKVRTLVFLKRSWLIACGLYVSRCQRIAWRCKV